MFAATVALATVMSGVVILPTVPAAQSLEDALKFAEEANELFKQHRYADAEPLYRRALAIYEQGPELFQRKYDRLASGFIAVTLNNLAELYRAQARYADAELLHKRSLAIKEKALGSNDPAVATSLQNLARLYSDQGRYADAEPLYKRSIAIREKAFGPNDARVAIPLNDLAGLYKDQGRYADAEPLLRRSLSIDEKALGPNHPTVATSLNNLALLYSIQGRYGDAEPLYERALAIHEKALGVNDPAVATALNNLATLYDKQGRYADAEPLLRRSLSINEKVLGLSHPDVATSLNNLASLYEAQGRYADAEPLYQRSLAIREKALGPDHPEVATSLSNLALLYTQLGRYAEVEQLSEVEQLYKRSLAIKEKVYGTNHPDVATALNNLAVLYAYQRRYAEAEPLCKRALAIDEKAVGPNHPHVANDLNNLARLYVDQARYADAEPLLQRALGIDEKALGPNHPNVAGGLRNLADLYGHQGRYVEAEPLYKRSIAIKEKALGPNHPAVAGSLDALADLYNDQGRHADALPLYKRSFAMREKALGPDHPDLAVSLNNLARLHRSQGRFSDALPLVRVAAQKGFDRKDVHLAVLMGALTTSLIAQVEALNESYHVVQRKTSSRASDAINQLSMRFAARNDELAKLIRRDQDLFAENLSLDKILIDAVSKESNKRTPVTEQHIRDRLKSIATERTEIGTYLIQRFPQFATLWRPSPLSVKETQKLLGDDEALVVFDFDSESYAWGITRQHADWVELKLTAKELSEQVKTLRSSLTFNIDKPFDTQLAHRIYMKTFGAIADKLQGKAHLLVVTNGAFTGLPFQLLVTKDPSKKPLKDVDWLVRSYAVTNLPSVTSLKTLRSTASHSSAQKPMIAFADPVFSKDGKKQIVTLRNVADFYEAGGRPDLVSLAKALAQLPDTANEVRAIANVLKADRNDLKLGGFASEAAVKQTKLDDYRIVYFATHGLVAGEVEKFAKVKAEPALALTIPETPTELDDGLLTASEIAQLKLDADWAVLSACNTAAEGNPGAEALSGLARAFFYAGARSLVVSHWEVDSQATVELMTGMFQVSARDRKLSHGEALRQSMLMMIDKAKSEEDAHPRIWAPFVVVGEPGTEK
jgi:CHAT domain-containing protein/Tfp pilus assembly protein PilF